MQTIIKQEETEETELAHNENMAIADNKEDVINTTNELWRSGRNKSNINHVVYNKTGAKQYAQRGEETQNKGRHRNNLMR